MSEFDKYRLPTSVTAGVAITLPGTTHEFRVKLPTQHNRAWRRYVLQTMADFGATFDDKGELSVEKLEPARLADWQDARVRAFVELCVVSCPLGITTDDLLNDFAPAADALFAAALELAEQEDATAGEAAKKSPVSSRGKSRGLAEKNSTKVLRAQADFPSHTDGRM